MSVRRAQQEITAREFSEWLAFGSLEPWGDQRADLRSAIVAATIANVHRSRDTRPFAPADFMPRFDREPKRAASPAEIAAKLSAYFRAYEACATQRLRTSQRSGGDA